MATQIRPTGECFCGCGRGVSRGAYWKTGHDKKAEGDMNAIHHGDSVVRRLVDLGYGPGGRNLHETAVAVGVREICGYSECATTGAPGSDGLRKHRLLHEDWDGPEASAR